MSIQRKKCYMKNINSPTEDSERITRMNKKIHKNTNCIQNKDWKTINYNDKIKKNKKRR